MCASLLVALAVAPLMLAPGSGLATESAAEQEIAANVATEVSWGSAGDCTQNLQTNDFGALTPVSGSSRVEPFDASPHMSASTDSRGDHVWVSCVTANTGLASVTAQGLSDMQSAGNTLPLSAVAIGVTNAQSGVIDGGQAGCVINPEQQTQGTCSLEVGAAGQALLTGAQPGTTELDWQYQLNLPANQATGTYTGGEVVFTATAGNGSSAAPANVTPPTLSPTSAQEGTNIATTNGRWTNNPTSYSYQWQRCTLELTDCLSIAGASDNAYPAVTQDTGYVIRSIVTASNAAGSSSAESAPTHPITGVAPTNTSPPRISGVTREGHTLTATAGTWSGSEPISYTYQWLSCDAAGENCTSIAGAIQSTHLLDHTDVGTTLRVLLTATNSAGPATATSAPTAVVALGEPVNLSPPSISGEPIVENTLSASRGTWTGSEPISYTYQWLGCDSGGQNCTAINSASEPTYTPTEGDIGRTLRVQVTATNAVASAEATSIATAPVESSAEGSPCDDTWTGAGGDGSWDTARNWARGTIPNGSDHVCILSDVTVTVYDSGDEAGWITDYGTLVLAPGSLTVNGPTPSALVGLTIERGTLGGAGEIDVSESFTGGGYGTMKGSGITVIQQGAAGTITPTGGTGFYLEGRTVENDGVLTVQTGSGLGGFGQAHLLNAGTLVVNGETAGDNHGLTASEGQAFLANTGTIEKNEGTGTTPISFTTDNEGAVLASSGEIEFIGGGTSGSFTPGSWSARTGSAIVFRSSFQPVFLGATAKMAGSIYVTEGTVSAGTIEGPMASINTTGNGGRFRGTFEVNGIQTSTLAALNVIGGTFTGSGDVEVTDSFTGGGYGSLEGTGTLVLEPSASGEVNTGGSWLSLRQARILHNEGSLTIGPASGIEGSETAQILNSGTLTVNGEGPSSNYGLLGETAVLTNTGVVQKTQGPGTAEISFQVNNEGMVSSESGQLELAGGGTWGGGHSGEWATHNDATIVFRHGQFYLGTQTTMSGSISVIDDGGFEGKVRAGKIDGENANLTVTGDGFDSRGGELELTEGVSTIQDLTVSGTRVFYIIAGTLRGPGEVNVTHSFTGGGLGTLAGKLTLTLQPGATGTIGPYWMTLDEATLINETTLTIPTDAGIVANSGSHIQNNATMTVNGQEWASNYGLLGGNGEATLTNTGTIQKTEGTGITVVSFAFDNEGLVRAESGEIEFSGGGNSGQLAVNRWSTQPAATIALSNFFNANYSLGPNATIAGNFIIASNVSAGTIEGQAANVTSLIGDITLTGLTASTLNSLAFDQPEPNFYNKQTLDLTGGLDISGGLRWSSNSAWLEGPGSIILGPQSSNAFSPSAWVQLHGGQFVNEGTLTWESGGIDASGENGVFFLNSGTLHINQNATNPVFYGCRREPNDAFHCPVLENTGVITAVFPSGHPHIEWRVSIANYGQLDTPYEQEPECKWEFSETPGPGTEACYRAIREFEGLLLQEGASVY